MVEDWTSKIKHTQNANPPSYCYAVFSSPLPVLLNFATGLNRSTVNHIFHPPPKACVKKLLLGTWHQKTIICQSSGLARSNGDLNSDSLNHARVSHDFDPQTSWDGKFMAPVRKPTRQHHTSSRIVMRLKYSPDRTLIIRNWISWFTHLIRLQSWSVMDCCNIYIYINFYLV